MNDAPKLLIEWSSPWEEFRSSIGPALRRSPRPLAGEARSGLVPYKGMLFGCLLQVTLLLAVLILQQKLTTMHVYAPPSARKYDVIYFSGDELPKTEDASGAQAGRSGSAGGDEAHHATQTIRVARGTTVREKVVDAPKLDLRRTDAAVENLLAYKAVPGSPPVAGLRSSVRVQELPQSAIAPSPQLEREKIRASDALNPSVVAPAPTAPNSELAKMRLPGNQTAQVVPPPVSAPEQITNTKAQLTLPAALVVAPAPDQIVRERSNGAGLGADELRPQVVPPAAQLGSASQQQRSSGGLGKADVVAPPVEVASLSSGNRNPNSLGGSAVAPPAVQLSGSLQESSSGYARARVPAGEASVVPPSPSLSSGAGGHGNRGQGLSGAFDSGAAAPAPATASKNGTGVVISSRPGSEVGVPGKSAAGSIALSPSGGAKPGLGGAGGGTGINRGAGGGSGVAGEGSGARKEGTGRGAETNAHAGISPTPGPGGAGNGTNGQPPMAGVSVKGGSNNITLPSFETSSPKSSNTERASLDTVNHGPGITVVGTSRSGGAFNFYGALKGDKVYTIYIETSLGTAVMQYADPASAAHPYAEDLVAPQPMRADLPANLHNSRLVIACILNRSGELKNAQVLEPGGGEMTSKVLAALPSWKFRPVLRGDQPVEVNAILGFDIDTR
ncbi:MAG: hypothetical protein ABJA69_07070 [Acidobacteriaceae bacterium]